MNHVYNFNEFMLNEKFSFKEIIKKIKQKPRKDLINYLIISLLSLYSITTTINILNKQNFNEEVKQEIRRELVEEVKDKKYKKGYEFILSQEGWDFIRNEEKLRLEAYNTKDDKITIGYGHAEPIETSQYQVGDKITKEKAYNLFVEDVNKAAKGVKRIFRQWEKEGLNVKITQNQYDVLVSLAFNMGITGLRTSTFIQHLKKKEYQKAGELIEKTGLKSGFSGLNDRRKKESKKFLQDVGKSLLAQFYI